VLLIAEILLLLGVKYLVLLPFACWATCALFVTLVYDRTCGAHWAMFWLVWMSDQFDSRLEIVREILVLKLQVIRIDII